MDRCVPISGISGVQTGNGNRLLLFLRDQRIISVNLERACRARDFYSGFYIERNRAAVRSARLNACGNWWRSTTKNCRARCGSHIGRIS